MNRRAIVVVVLMCLQLLLPTPAIGQTSEVERDLDAAKELYRAGQMDDAVTALRQVIAELNRLRDYQSRKIQLADAHLHLALSYVALRDESSALENFRQVAALDAQRTLDPDVYSPKVITLFERARADVDGVRKPPDLEASDSAPRSALVPAAPMMPGLAVGTKLRLTFGDDAKKVVGTLVASDGESVTVLGAASTSIAVPRSGLTRLEVVQSRKSHWLMGLLVGAATGAILGALETPGCGGNDGDCYTRGENIGYGAGGAAIVGGLVGALVKTDEWIEVPTSRVDPVKIAQLGPRAMLAFSWR